MTSAQHSTLTTCCYSVLHTLDADDEEEDWLVELDVFADAVGGDRLMDCHCYWDCPGFPGRDWPKVDPLDLPAPADPVLPLSTAGSNPSCTSVPESPMGV